MNDDQDSNLDQQIENLDEHDSVSNGTGMADWQMEIADKPEGCLHLEMDKYHLRSDKVVNYV